MNAGRNSDSVITSEAYAVHGSNATRKATASAKSGVTTRRARR